MSDRDRPGEVRGGLTAQGSPEQIPALTGLRFLAAAAVLVAHDADWVVQFSDSDANRWLSFLAMYGMPLFFVLSGFVIHYNYRRLFESRGYGEAILRFAAARIARLYPLYLFFLIFSFLVAGSLMRSGTAAVLPYYLTLTQSWFYKQFNGHLLLYYTFGLSWSVSTEAFFYIVYGLIAPLLIMLSGARRSIVAVTVFCLVSLTVADVASADLDQILAGAKMVLPDYGSMFLDPQDSFTRWLFYFSPYTRVMEFVLGALTAQLFIELRRRPVTRAEWWGGQAMSLVAILGLAGLGYLLLTGQPAAFAQIGGFLAQNFGCAPELAILIFCASRYRALLARCLGGRFVVALGETSFSIYMVHTWTLGLFVHAPAALTTATGFDACLRFLFGFAFTLIVASATYRLIEVPGRRFLRLWSGRAISALLARFSAAARVTTARHRWGRSAAAMLCLMFGCLAVQFGGQAYGMLTGGIRIDEASYGLNCRDFRVPAPFPNMVARGNATSAAQDDCGGMRTCDLKVSVDRLGDPANSCGKDFSVVYHCLGRGASYSAYLPPEASGHHVLLRCSPAR